MFSCNALTALKQNFLAEVVVSHIGMQHTCVCALIACLENKCWVAMRQHVKQVMSINTFEV